MNEMTRIALSEAATRLNRGEIGIIPTDTIYGFVASALLPDAVERLYASRGRNERKPCIVLIADMSDIEQFGRMLSSKEKQLLERVWPGKVSVILSGFPDRFSYLHRGTGTLAFRVPDVSELCDMLRRSGPIIAPSANPEGMKPAETIEEAEAYFGDRANFLVDGGTLSGSPSTIVRLEVGRFTIVRPGAAEDVLRLEHLSIQTKHSANS